MTPLNRATSVVFRYRGDRPTAPLPPGYEKVILDHTSVRDLFGRPTGDDWRARVYPRLLSGGSRGIAAVDPQGLWAAVQWIAPPGADGPTHLPRRLIRPHFWCFNEHTREGHRRLGLWRALKSSGFALARDLSGADVTLYSDTETENLPSRRAHEAFGFTHEGVMSTLTLRYARGRRLVFGGWDREAPHPERSTTAP
ncbi:hypothetical protein [Microbacterium sp. K36]|uniref:hypothetical protein n=1 Tax=Microbacterium sp. K36 TaxID=2305439 RepID=UPI00144413D3|nr:hypothetical protein [Microbacterium sp. K36]